VLKAALKQGAVNIWLDDFSCFVNLQRPFDYEESSVGAPRKSGSESKPALAQLRR